MTREIEDNNKQPADNDALAEELSRTLLESKLAEKDPEQLAVDHLSPRWEIRTMAELDPIVAETLQVRKYVKEVDDRYDRYLQKARLLQDDAKRSDKQ